MYLYTVCILFEVPSLTSTNRIKKSLRDSAESGTPLASGSGH